MSVSGARRDVAWRRRLQRRARAPAERASAPHRAARWRTAAKIAFVLGVLAVLVYAARQVPWGDVFDTLRDTRGSTIAAALALAATGYAVVASFDLLGRLVTGHGLSWPVTMRVAAVCYAVNQNFGYLIGGLALRLRLYRALGLEVAEVAAVAGTSVLTNWMGHFVLLGGLLLVAPLPLPADWPVSTATLRAVGIAAIVVALGYLVACASARRRSWRLRSLELTLPSGRVALLQLGLGASSWLLMGAIVWVALPPGIAYPTVVTTLLLGAVAGAIAHVPAGLGVLEGVFVAMLGRELALPQIVAALVVYRAAYQLVPAAIALPIWWRWEHRPPAAAPTALS